MYGWINDAIEKLIISRYGESVWITIKKLAQCDIEVNQWVINREYPDYLTDNLITSACNYLGDRVSNRDNLLVEVGEFFLTYVRKKGYDHMMRCQGGTFKEWLSNINKVHSHLQLSLGKDFDFPELYCTEDEDPPPAAAAAITTDVQCEGSFCVPAGFSGKEKTKTMTLYYKSKRMTMLNGFVLGMVKEAAMVYFQMSFSAVCLSIQGVNEAEFTSWKIVTRPLVSTKKRFSQNSFSCLTKTDITSSKALLEHKIVTLPEAADADDNDDDKDTPEPMLQCPFTGKSFVPTEEAIRRSAFHRPREASSTNDSGTQSVAELLTLNQSLDSVDHQGAASPAPSSLKGQHILGIPDNDIDNAPGDGGLSGAQVREIFPFHIAVNRDFIITHMGKKLRTYISQIRVGVHIGTCFDIVVPASCKWDWDAIHRCKDSVFELQPKARDGIEKSLQCRLSGGVYFTASSRYGRETDDPKMTASFLVQPDVRSLEDMVTSGLTWSDFPKHSAQPNLILLAEHLKSETYQSMKSRQEAINTKNILEMKRIFVRYVSHEIRTPLNTACMGINLVQTMKEERERLPSKSQDGNKEDAAEHSSSDAPTTEVVVSNPKELFEMAEEIKESCEIAVSILNDLLLYEKLEGQVLQLERKCEPALLIISEAMNLFSVQAKQANIKLNLTFDAEVDGKVSFQQSEMDKPSIYIDADKPKISQVIRNLVSNAIKFTKLYGGSRVEVHASIRSYNMTRQRSFTDEYVRRHSFSSQGSFDAEKSKSDHRSSCNQRYLRLEIKDTGPGITLEDQAKLFENIVQFDPSKLQGGNGTGLGLFISKGIMDLHGGLIGVHSLGKGHGATFYLELPAHGFDEACIHYDSTPHPAATTATTATALQWAQPCEPVNSKNRPCVANALNEWRDAGATSSHGISPNLSLGTMATASVLPTMPASALNKLKEPLIAPKKNDDAVSSTVPSPKTTIVNATNAHTPPAAVQPSSSISSQSQSAPVNLYNVLVVDDSAPTRKMLVRYLKLHKLCDSPTEANDGLKAVNIVKETLNNSKASKFHCILMDFVMPEMDGPTATSEIRQSGFNGLIVGITGNVLPDDRNYFISCGADAVMAKPVDMAKLKELLEKELAKRRRREQRRRESNKKCAPGAGTSANSDTVAADQQQARTPTVGHCSSAGGDDEDGDSDFSEISPSMKGGLSREVSMHDPLESTNRSQHHRDAAASMSVSNMATTTFDVIKNTLKRKVSTRLDGIFPIDQRLAAAISAFAPISSSTNEEAAAAAASAVFGKKVPKSNAIAAESIKTENNGNSESAPRPELPPSRKSSGASVKTPTAHAGGDDDQLLGISPPLRVDRYPRKPSLPSKETNVPKANHTRTSAKAVSEVRVAQAVSSSSKASVTRASMNKGIGTTTTVDHHHHHHHQPVQIATTAKPPSSPGVSAGQRRDHKVELDLGPLAQGPSEHDSRLNRRSSRDITSVGSAGSLVTRGLSLGLGRGVDRIPPEMLANIRVHGERRQLSLRSRLTLALHIPFMGSSNSRVSDDGLSHMDILNHSNASSLGANARRKKTSKWTSLLMRRITPAPSTPL